MKLLVVSHKNCWRDPTSPSGYSTDGGFPQQIGALAGLFDETSVAVCQAIGDRPPGLAPVAPAGVEILAVPPPAGRGLMRKLGMFPWLGGGGVQIWKRIRRADAVHTPIPGDVGAVALLMAVVAKKRVFVRHCGTWGDRSTLANRFLAWFLPAIARDRVVVMATGGGPEAPEPHNPAIQWIFATSFSQAEYDAIVPAVPWRPEIPLRIVMVGRLTRGKNTLACIEALPDILEAHPGSSLNVVGEGPFRKELEEAVVRLGLEDSVTIAGNLGHEAVLDVLRRSHLFLFPTQVAEGFPKAVVEAMACGLPIVASRVSVLPHLLRDGCGVVLDGSSPADVAGAVVRLTRTPELMAEMGRKAHRRAGKYTLERWRDLVGDRLEAAWGRPLRSQGSRSPREPEAAD